MYKIVKKLRILQKFLILVSLLSLSVILFIYLFQKNLPDWDIVFIVDVSHSMNSKVWDWLFTRLDLAKKTIENIIKKDDNHHKFWIIIFNQTAEYYVAPTFDTWTLMTFVKALNTNILPWWWTNLKSALKIFEYNDNYKKDIAVIISDWDQISIDKKDFLKLNIISICVWDWKKRKVYYPDWTLMYDTWWNIVYSQTNCNNMKTISKFSKNIYSKFYKVSSISDTNKIKITTKVSFNSMQKWLILAWILFLIWLRI